MVLTTILLGRNSLFWWIYWNKENSEINLISDLSSFTEFTFKCKWCENCGFWLTILTSQWWHTVKILNISPRLMDIFKHILRLIFGEAYIRGPTFGGRGVYLGGLYSGRLYSKGIFYWYLHIKTLRSFTIVIKYPQIILI